MTTTILEKSFSELMEEMRRRRSRAGCSVKSAADRPKWDKDRPMQLAIDFDGTIVEDAFPEIGKLRPEAKAFINKVRERGYKWILWTVRFGDYLKDALKFLKENDLMPDAVNHNLPWFIMNGGDDSPKVYADYYIDDKSSGGLVWPEI